MGWNPFGRKSLLEKIAEKVGIKLSIPVGLYNRVDLTKSGNTEEDAYEAFFDGAKNARATNAFPVELRKVEGKGLTLSSYYKVIGTVYVPKPTQSQADFEAS